MSPRHLDSYVRDMLDAMDRIDSYLQPFASAEELAKAPAIVDAVGFRLAVIGEAARCAAPGMNADDSPIPWKELRHLRNLLVHEYWNCYIDTLWFTAKEVLPKLREPLARILAVATVEPPIPLPSDEE